ncbi:MAG: UPF0104 family protein [Simplicispira suum]|uniref:lysylphosphatidylglycerol synthase domain-containing protein n=1 Tax=Simplicispira suum TaxID=2109915 RepID=UPI001C6CDE8B|nr:lysylphosphatidylglycerol synthase domain-containing protein [Simplicispira suum]MBW7831974.1 UPF0104 family protein [Simplicispira suum]
MALARPTTPQAPTTPSAPSRLRPGRGAARTRTNRGATRPGGLAQLQEKPWWPWLTRSLAGAFFVLVASLIVYQARSVDWPAVWQAVLALPVRVLWAGAALALLSHFTYGSFEWIGRHVTGHQLGRATTLGIAMTSYAFTLNLGSVIGGVGVRYRLYSRRGVEPGIIGQVVATSILTNWIGYLLLTAIIPWFWVPPAVFGWSASDVQWRMGGALLALAPLAYLALCLVRGGRPLALRGHCFALPRWPLALWQVAVSCANWMLMGTALWVVLQGQVAYPAAVATVMLGAVAGLVLRVPAGLGVLESVGVALLTTDSLSKTDVLAALLAYRALYYFVPLVLAALAFAAAELLMHGKKPTK